MTQKRETQQVQQATPTPEETELNKLALERARAAQPGQLALQEQALNLGQEFIGGLNTGQSQSPILNRIFAGIDPDVTQGIVDQSLEDIRPGLQASGLLNSGVRAELEAQTASDIRRASEEADLNRLFNLLNISQGFPAQIQQPLLSQSQALGQRLAGLRTTTGSTTTTVGDPFGQAMKGIGSAAAIAGAIPSGGASLGFMGATGFGGGNAVTNFGRGF